MSVTDYELNWLNQHFNVSIQLSHVLKLNPGYGGPKRFQVLDAIAKELGIRDVTTLRDATYILIEGYVPALEKLLTEDPGSWISDIDTGRPRQVAHAAVDRLIADDVICVMRDFGWERDRVTASVVEVQAALAEALERRLAERTRKMIDRWRSSGRWTSKLKLGILSR
ncbi:MAG: hypothetical protein M0Z95_23925 [Actinomycetota bacterium]|jgi:hypothetical protein|nr:hypothetical protein [Actinomycetota bacterium]